MSGREIQTDYNQHHQITPTTIKKDIVSLFDALTGSDSDQMEAVAEPAANFESMEDLDQLIARLEKQMHAAAEELAFERAAQLRDRIRDLRQQGVFEL